jgi:putative hydrolase of the HAD superfamily
VFTTVPPPADRVVPKAVLVDYAGVLTSPIAETLARYATLNEITVEQLARAQADVAGQLGRAPMAALEVGAISEADFLQLINESLVGLAGHGIDVARFRQQWLLGRSMNDEFVSYIAELGVDGNRLVLATNNVREWRAQWQASIPVHIFEAIVDSSDIGVRKPDPAFFQVVLDRLGLGAGDCLLVDDSAENCTAARALGFAVVHFRDTRQAIAELDRALAHPPR